MTTPAEAITAGVVAAVPLGKNKQPARTRRPISSPPPPCLWRQSQCHRGWRRRRTSRRKIQWPPWTWEFPTTQWQRRNRCFPFIIFTVGICAERKIQRWGVKHEHSLSSASGPVLCYLVRVFTFSLRNIGGGAASLSPLVNISFETLCLVIIFSLYWYNDHWFHLKYSDEQYYSTSFIIYR